MNKITYQNKYGFLEFEVIEAYREVATIHSKDLQQDVFFEIDDAEKIALITENKGIQLSVNQGHTKMFLIHHKTSNIAAVCRVIKIDFNSKFNAREILETPSKPYGATW